MELTYRTGRLELRVLPPQYAPEIQQFYLKNQYFLKQYEPMRNQSFYSLKFQQANMAFEYNSFMKRNYFRTWLFLQEDRKTPIGTVCFSNFLRGDFSCCTLGYKMDKDYCEQGYMKEALSRLLPIVQKEYHFRRIQAMVLPNNEKSIHLLKGLGFREEGRLRQYAQIQNKWEDHVLYSLVADTE